MIFKVLSAGFGVLLLFLVFLLRDITVGDLEAIREAKNKKPDITPTYCITTYADRPGFIVPCQRAWKDFPTWLKDGEDI